MTKMEICSEAEDLQTSKLNELKPNGGGGAQAASPTGNENLLTVNGSIDSPSLELNEAPSKPSSSHRGARSARREGPRTKHRQTRPLSRTRQNTSSQARPCKQTCPRAMADCAKITSDSHLRQLPHWASRQNLQRARPRPLADLTSFRYLQKDLFPPPALQIFFLDLLAKVWV
jgi:hypothetical protein